MFDDGSASSLVGLLRDTDRGEEGWAETLAAAVLLAHVCPSLALEQACPFLC